MQNNLVKMVFFSLYVQAGQLHCSAAAILDPGGQLGLLGRPHTDWESQGGTADPLLTLRIAAA